MIKFQALMYMIGQAIFWSVVTYGVISLLVSFIGRQKYE